jgi:ubiquinone/menaquinone biosynthesis C-methylase UbiE
VSAWDALAADYDRTRGGEERGDQYAADLDDRLPPGPGPVLEVGVGTGVVALGLRQRGRRVVGIDLSAPMLARGRARLGPCLVRGDACRLPFAVRSFPAAVSVWVIHTIDSPQDLLAEVTRVLRPGGRYLIATTQRPGPEDQLGAIMAELFLRLDVVKPRKHGPEPIAPRVAGWAHEAGLRTTVETIEREWVNTPGDEMAAITGRMFPALRELDEDAFAHVTGPTLEALARLPPGPITRRGLGEIITVETP